MSRLSFRLEVARNKLNACCITRNKLQRARDRGKDIYYRRRGDVCRSIATLHVARATVRDGFSFRPGIEARIRALAAYSASSTREGNV